MGPLEGDGPARAAAAASPGKHSARHTRPGPTPASGFTRSGRARAVTHNLKVPKVPKGAGGGSARIDFADVLSSAAERREAARKARAAARPAEDTPGFARTFCSFLTFLRHSPPHSAKACVS